MKYLLRIVLLLVALSLSGSTALAGKVSGKDNPSLISDEIAFRQLFALLHEDKKAPTSHQAIQCFCDHVLKLTQPEKEELLQLVNTFHVAEKHVKDSLAADENEKDPKKKLSAEARKKLSGYRKNLGKYVAEQFSGKEKLDAVLERVKRDTTLDSESDEF